MDQYKQYLATQVINEQQIVNYRQLSRALKVHVNTAKQMLYSFHKDRNGKRPGSVHATYQIIGRRPAIRYSSANGVDHDDEDVDMEGNPFQSSAPDATEEAEEEEAIPVTAVVLVQEEELEAAKETFDVIETIFVYSLESSKLQDIQLLSTCNAEMRKKVEEDPLETWKIYGGIRDPNCKRRTARKPPGAAAAAPPVATTTTTAKPKAPEPVKETPAPSKGPASKAAPAAKPKSNPFANFKKTAGPIPSAKAAPPPAEDTAMADAPPAMESDDGGDDDDDFPVVTSKQSMAESRKAREEREARLRAMMEEDDEEEEVETKKEKDSDGDEDMADAGETEEPTAEAAAKAADVKAPVGSEQNVSVENGRRRGRRKIVKKKTVKDEEGYLVTKEEQVWESFSEDEPEPKKLKSAFPAAKKKAPAGKPGQGNIMSFFSKK